MFVFRVYINKLEQFHVTVVFFLTVLDSTGLEFYWHYSFSLNGVSRPIIVRSHLALSCLPSDIIPLKSLKEVTHITSHYSYTINLLVLD